METQQKGVLLTLSAFIWWGLVPIYFKLLTGVEPFEILAHRIIWSLLTLALFMWWLGKPFKVIAILKNTKLLWMLIASSILISINWLIFAWAVTNDQILATSLGYFINPLLSVLFGVLFLSERLSRNQTLALGLVVIAVINQVAQYGELPWVALSLAFSFGLYGLVRKKAEIDAFNGLLIEVILMLPLAIAYLVYKTMNGSIVFMQQSLSMDIYLFLGGIITTVPLVLFAAGTKLIKLSIVGFIQYIAPTITFLLAVWFYGEPLGLAKLISFIMIWVALVLISLDALRENQRQRKALAK